MDFCEVSGSTVQIPYVRVCVCVYWRRRTDSSLLESVLLGASFVMGDCV